MLKSFIFLEEFSLHLMDRFYERELDKDQQKTGKIINKPYVFKTDRDALERCDLNKFYGKFIKSLIFFHNIKHEMTYVIHTPFSLEEHNQVRMYLMVAMFFPNEFSTSVAILPKPLMSSYRLRLYGPEDKAGIDRSLNSIINYIRDLILRHSLIYQPNEKELYVTKPENRIFPTYSIKVRKHFQNMLPSIFQSKFKFNPTITKLQYITNNTFIIVLRNIPPIILRIDPFRQTEQLMKSLIPQVLITEQSLNRVNIMNCFCFPGDELVAMSDRKKLMVFNLRKPVLFKMKTEDGKYEDLHSFESITIPCENIILSLRAFPSELMKRDPDLIAGVIKSVGFCVWRISKKNLSFETRMKYCSYEIRDIWWLSNRCILVEDADGQLSVYEFQYLNPINEFACFRELYEPTQHVMYCDDEVIIINSHSYEEDVVVTFVWYEENPEYKEYQDIEFFSSKQFLTKYQSIQLKSEISTFKYFKKTFNVQLRNGSFLLFDFNKRKDSLEIQTYSKNITSIEPIYDNNPLNPQMFAQITVDKILFFDTCGNTSEPFGSGDNCFLQVFEPNGIFIFAITKKYDIVVMVREKPN